MATRDSARVEFESLSVEHTRLGRRACDAYFAQAAFDLEDALATERDAQVTLAESIGIIPTTAIQVTDFAALPAPATLESRFVQVGRVGMKGIGEQETRWGCPTTYGEGRAASGVSATLIVG
jgi:hypothetical protein